MLYHAWCGAARPVRMYYSPAAQTARSRCSRAHALFQRVICSLSRQVWQLADGNFRSGAVQTARRHQSGISSLAVSTSGSRLVSCSSEGTIIWGVQANRITLLCSCCVPTFSAAPLSLDSNDDIVLQVPLIAMRHFFRRFIVPCRETKWAFAVRGHWI